MHIVYLGYFILVAVYICLFRRKAIISMQTLTFDRKDQFVVEINNQSSIYAREEGICSLSDEQNPKAI